MSNITLRQKPDTAYEILYPNSDVSSGFLRSAGTVSYVLVNDSWNNPNDTTYISTSSTSEVSALFGLEDSANTVEEINYITLSSRARITPNVQDADGVYKNYVKINGTDYESDSFAPITTAFSSYRNNYITNPDTGTSWTWSDINNLQQGIKASTPGDALTLTLRPSGNGTYQEWAYVYGAASHYLAVNDVTPDDNSTYIYQGSAAPDERDTYTLPNHTTEVGDITQVEVFFRVKQVEENARLYAALVYTGGTLYFGDEESHIGAWATYSHVWTNNPKTSSAWTWTDIDNLEIGVFGAGSYSYCTQVYAVVTYRPGIVVSQLYTVIQYEPDEITLELPQPMNLNMNHSRKTNRYTFPDGGYEVEDMGRQGKTITLNGYIYDKDTSVIYEKAQSIADMVHYRSAVSLSGMTDPNFNKEYYIKDFNYEQRGGEPYLYKWALILEES